MSARPTTQYVVGTNVFPAAGSAVMIPLEYMGGAFQCSIQVVVSSGATAVFEVDATLDPANDFLSNAFPNGAGTNDQDNSNGLYTAKVTALTGNWVAVTGMTGLAGGTVTQGNLAFPAIALRLRCTTAGTGYAVIRVLNTSVPQ